MSEIETTASEAPNQASIEFRHGDVSSVLEPARRSLLRLTRELYHLIATVVPSGECYEAGVVIQVARNIAYLKRMAEVSDLLGFVSGEEVRRTQFVVALEAMVRLLTEDPDEGVGGAVESVSAELTDVEPEFRGHATQVEYGNMVYVIGISYVGVVPQKYVAAMCEMLGDFIRRGLLTKLPIAAL